MEVLPVELAAKKAVDYLENHRQRFLVLSLDKFSLPETIDLSTENINEISSFEEELLISNGGERKTSLASKTLPHYVALSGARKMAEQEEDEDLAAAAQQLLVAAYGNNYEEIHPTLTPNSIESRILYLTNCLWRYLPLRNMTTYHLYAVLKLLSDNNSSAESIKIQREIFPELVQALGTVISDIEYDGHDLELCSLVLQVLAAFPEYKHGEAAPKETADVSLRAITAFSNVPRVVEQKNDLHNKAAELAQLLTHGNSESIAFGLGGGRHSHDNEEVEEAAFNKLLQLEKMGATAAAALLRQNCRGITRGVVSTNNQLNTSFTDNDLAQRTSNLLSVLSKLSHNNDLLCSTAPIVFESMQRAMDSGMPEVFLPEDVSFLSVILCKCFC
jgi:hypothetical protein